MLIEIYLFVLFFCFYCWLFTTPELSPVHGADIQSIDRFNLEINMMLDEVFNKTTLARSLNVDRRQREVEEVINSNKIVEKLA